MRVFWLRSISEPNHVIHRGIQFERHGNDAVAKTFRRGGPHGPQGLPQLASLGNDLTGLGADVDQFLRGSPAGRRPPSRIFAVLIDDVLQILRRHESVQGNFRLK